jgi:hypothetical protein
MLNNVAIDVFIGLIFVFLMYSLLATILQEMIARFLQLRGKNLLKAVRVMLEDREHVNGSRISRWFEHVRSNISHFFCPFPKDSMAKAFYSHPSVKYLGQSALDSKPSYLGPENFSTTLVKLLRGEDFVDKTKEMEAIGKTLFEKLQVTSGNKDNPVVASIDPETLEHLKQLYIDSSGKIEDFKKLVENWFDETMQRASGWYKKQTQLVLFIIGIVVAVAFNIDTIAIYNILSKDKKAREEFVQLAANAAVKYDTLNQKLTRVPVKDSVPVVEKDSTGTIKDTTGWNYTERDTILVSDKELKEAKAMLLDDMNEASNILGIGRDWNDSCSKCRQTMVSITNSNLPGAQKEACIEALRCGGIPCHNKFCVNGRGFLQWHPLQKGGIVTLVGWLLTALSISLGAPFWFDMLNKIMQLRGSVKPKEEKNKK